MCHVRVIAMLLALVCVSACGNNDFNNAYSNMSLGGVGPIPLDD